PSEPAKRSPTARKPAQSTPDSAHAMVGETLADQLSLRAMQGTALTGQVLIAMPAMADPRFAQSVIYLCAHTSEGAMGIVVNKPLAAPSFEDLLRQLKVDP